MRQWLEVKAVLDRAPDDWAALHDAFDTFGMPGTVQTDSPPTLSAYAPNAGEGLDLDALEVRLVALGARRVELRLVPEEDWAEAWKQFFKPRRIGERFLVRPTWEEAPKNAAEFEIVLDPGQAFGTGDHPTTQLVLRLLEQTDLGDRRVLDVGCGTGILAIAAKMLGAKEVVAIDLDPESVRATRENAERNGVEVVAQVGDLLVGIEDHAPFDVAISNIISATIIRLTPQLPKVLASGGLWILSGVHRDNWGDVRDHAERHGFAVRTYLEDSDWIAALLHL
jgi:ribosomal protein L11 methyltransferase